MRQKQKRIYQAKMWEAARRYRRDAEKCYKARAHFAALVVRVCELEALLRIFDFVENRRPKNRCKELYGLINRAFARHWIPHDGLRYWRRTHRTPLKKVLHELREARNGVHAHLFQKDLFTRRTASNVAYVVESVYALFEIKNARNLMSALRKSGEISAAEYNAWKRKQTRLVE